MTGFSSEWDERYQENTHMSIWPWSTLVSFVMRYSNPNVAGFRVLELGCGAGANIPFFVNLGIDYYAVEGSESIVTRLHSKFPQLKDNIVCGDFTQTLPEMEFHLIVDRGSLTCNDTSAIRRCLRMCHNRLKTTACISELTGIPLTPMPTEKGSKQKITIRERILLMAVMRTREESISLVKNIYWICLPTMKLSF